MAAEGPTKRRVSLVRLALLAAGLGPAAYGLVLGFYWLCDHIPKWAFWKAGLIFLSVLETAYAVAVFAAVALGLASSFWLLRSRPGTSRASHGRRLLACISLMFGVVIAESASAVWQHRAHRSTAMPIGGLRENPRRRAMAIPIGASPRMPSAVEPPLEFRDPPGDRDIDLVIMGESSAEGVPFQKWLSIDRIVGWQLHEVIPERPIRLMSLAKSGDTLELQHRRLRDLRRRPDLLIILCGHNEFKARFSPGRTPEYYFADKLPTTPQVVLNHLGEFSPFCGLIGEAAEKCRISIPPSFDNRRDLIDVPVYSAADYMTLLTDFKRRLEAIVSYAERVGALPVLIVPPANDAGFEPNRSFLPAGTPRSEREAFRTAFLAARRLEEDDPGTSILHYRELLLSQPGFAEAHYRLARLLVRAGALDDAFRHFAAARDQDGYPMRCMTAFQNAYHEVAARHGCILIDGPAYFRKISRRGQLDDELFQDMMHPSLRGYVALSQAVLRALKARNAFGWPRDVRAPVINPARLAAHFHLGRETWTHVCRWQKFFNELVVPLRYDPAMRIRRKEEGLTATAQLYAGAELGALALPNVGIPADVPMVGDADGEARDAAGPSKPPATAAQGES